jgi:iron complex transport system substrate-binding protein
MTKTSKAPSESVTKPLEILTLVRYVSEILTHWEVPHTLASEPVTATGENAPATPPTAEIAAQGGPSETESDLSNGLTVDPVDLEMVRRLAPRIIITDFEGLDSESERVKRQAELSQLVGRDVQLIALRARTLEGVYGAIEKVGEVVGRAPAAREMCNRIKAQIMDWCDSFYDRMKNKRVTVLSSVTPLRLAGRWLPDLVKAASCIPQYIAVGAGAKEVTWREVEEFRPDVIVVAPEGFALEESVKTLRFLERYPSWESLPAVKRGEVVFCDGLGLYLPGPRMLSGVSHLISGLAGLESGYITPRDSFYRLRWVELHRHRF